jgi:phage protein D
MGERPIHQRAACRITVAGVDVTDRINPRLLNVTVIDKFGGISEAHIELDDRYGQVVLPEGNDPIEVDLGWPDEGLFTVFKGHAYDVESAGQKRGGRTLTIIARGHDELSKIKEQARWSLGDGSEDVQLGDALKKAAKIAGVDLKVDSKLANLSRKFWMGQNESFMAYAQRIAGETGGAFKIAGNQASFSRLDSFNNADGIAMSNTIAEAGKNLIAWRVSPQIARPQFGNTQHTHFDPMQAKWLVEKSLSGNLSKADFTGVGAQADKDNAKQQADSDAIPSRAERAKGWVLIDGSPTSMAGGQLTIIGARPGVDGSNYRVTEVEQSYSSQGGYTTRIDFNLLGSSASQEIS